MSYRHTVCSRAGLASAALLSLALLAGCQSNAGTSEDGSANADMGSTNNGSINDPGEQQVPFGTALQQVGDRVHFALDHYDLTPEAEATLRKQAALLQNHPEITVTIQGHADERGTREYNLALGERRAETVRNYLMALGVPGERISVISYGKERPECAAADETCWAQNRRGVTVASR